MQPAIIVDRDGTLASVAHVAPSTRDNWAWQQYNAAMPFDAVVPGVLDIVNDWRSANPDGVVIMVSGRAAGDYRGDLRRYYQMVAWIQKHSLPIDRLFMRRGGDQRRDSIVKREIFDQHLAGNYDFHFAIDDRPQVIEVWKELGIPVIEVVDPGILPPICGET